MEPHKTRQHGTLKNPRTPKESEEPSLQTLTEKWAGCPTEKLNRANTLPLVEPAAQHVSSTQ